MEEDELRGLRGAAAVLGGAEACGSDGGAEASCAHHRSRWDLLPADRQEWAFEGGQYDVHWRRTETGELRYLLYDMSRIQCRLLFAPKSLYEYFIRRTQYHSSVIVAELSETAAAAVTCGRIMNYCCLCDVYISVAWLTFTVFSLLAQNEWDWGCLLPGKVWIYCEQFFSSPDY